MNRLKRRRLVASINMLGLSVVALLAGFAGGVAVESLLGPGAGNGMLVIAGIVGLGVGGVSGIISGIAANWLVLKGGGRPAAPLKVLATLFLISYAVFLILSLQIAPLLQAAFGEGQLDRVDGVILGVGGVVSVAAAGIVVICFSRRAREEEVDPVRLT